MGETSSIGKLSTAIALATGGYATAEQIGWSQAQILAIRNDPWFAGGDYYDHPQGPEVGLAIARRIAHLTRGQPWPDTPPPGRALFTGPVPEALRPALARHGLTETARL